MTGLKNIAIKLKDSEYTIGLDNKEGDINYLSHAHADHLFSFKKKVLCSNTTALMANIKEELIECELKEGIKLYNAGHIVGSTQIKLNSEKFGELVYTGDFKLRDGLTVNGAKIIECDTLIIDGTYGAYDIKFKEPQQLYQEMKKWAQENEGCNIIWGGYKIGKAQELVKFLNEYLDIVPLVSEEIAFICKIYQAAGIKLEYISVKSEEAEEILRDKFHAVLDLHTIKEEFLYNLNRIYKNRTIAAIATGWAEVYRKQNHYIKMFGLSDHGDFNQLLQYCNESGAKKIFVAFGNNKKTAAKLRNHNIQAYAIEELENEIIAKNQIKTKQLTLDKF